MRSILLAFVLFYTFSCKEGVSVVAESAETGLLLDTLGYKLIFDEQNAMLLIQEAHDTTPFNLGHYYNTFRQPPHKIELFKLSPKHILVAVSTNVIQLGFSQDYLTLLSFNTQTKSANKLWSFDDMASRDANLDTMEAIRYIDYTLHTLSSHEYTFELVEYKPYVFDRTEKNLGLNIDTIRKEFHFSSNELP